MERAFWDELWRTGTTRWQLDQAAPPLVRLIDEVRPAGRALVLGCGRGHEVALLARRGLSVLGLDISTVALAGVTGPYVCGDVRRLPVRAGSVDVVLEHTCYCAIDRRDRPRYVSEVARVLRSGGHLLGLFYEPAAPGDPPFRVTREDLGAFEDAFTLERVERPADSVPQRAGQEWLAVFHRR